MPIDPSAVLRLVMPQWQGGDNPDYRVGSLVLAALVPEPLGPVVTISVPPAEAGEREKTNGIVSREALLGLLDQARNAIAEHRPDGIVTLGGDCLVDLAPIAYLNERYADDLAVLWIDAHPDVMNRDEYANAHAHVLGMLLGEGDVDFVAAVTRKVEARDVLYVGLTETTPFETGFIERNGLARLSPEALADTVEPVTEWLRATGKKHVAVHFDLDVLDPRLYDFLYFRNPDAAPGAFDGIAKGRMTMERVQAILNAVAGEAEIVGLAITEYLPWSAIKLADQLSALPLLGRACRQSRD